MKGKCNIKFSKSKMYFNWSNFIFFDYNGVPITGAGLNCTFSPMSTISVQLIGGLGATLVQNSS